MIMNFMHLNMMDLQCMDTRRDHHLLEHYGTKVLPHGRNHEEDKYNL